jgi:hypothetical protein
VKKNPKFSRFQLFVTIIDHMQIYNLQLTIVTQALNTRTHTNHTVVTTGSTKIVSQKWKNYLVYVAFDCLEASGNLLGGGGRGEVGT